MEVRKSKKKDRENTIPKVILIGGLHGSHPRSIICESVSSSLVENQVLYRMLLSQETLIVTENMDLTEDGEKMFEFLEGELRSEFIKRLFGERFAEDYFMDSRASICFADYRSLPDSLYNQFRWACGKAVAERFFYVRNRQSFAEIFQASKIKDDAELVRSMISRGVIGVNRKELRKLFAPVLEEGMDTFHALHEKAMGDECESAIIDVIEKNFNNFSHIVVITGYAHTDRLIEKYFYHSPEKNYGYLRYSEERTLPNSLYQKKVPKNTEKNYLFRFLLEPSPKLLNFIFNG